VLEPPVVVARREVAARVRPARLLARQRAHHRHLGQRNQVVELERVEEVRVVDGGMVLDRRPRGPLAIERIVASARASCSPVRNTPTSRSITARSSRRSA